MVQSGSTLDNMAWCRHHSFVVNSDDKEGLHWFVCAFDCRVRLVCFIIWVWELLSSIHLIHRCLSVLKKLCLTTKHWALGFQKDGWSGGFQSLHLTNWWWIIGILFRVPLTLMGPGFVDDVLSIVMLIVLCGSLNRQMMIWRA